MYDVFSSAGCNAWNDRRGMGRFSEIEDDESLCGRTRTDAEYLQVLQSRPDIFKRTVDYRLGFIFLITIVLTGAGLWLWLTECPPRTVSVVRTVQPVTTVRLLEPVKNVGYRRGPDVLSCGGGDPRRRVDLRNHVFVTSDNPLDGLAYHLFSTATPVPADTLCGTLRSGTHNHTGAVTNVSWLIHYTMKEIRIGPTLVDWHIPDTTSHLHVVRSCCRYIALVNRCRDGQISFSPYRQLGEIPEFWKVSPDVKVCESNERLHMNASPAVQLPDVCNVVVAVTVHTPPLLPPQCLSKTGRGGTARLQSEIEKVMNERIVELRRLYHRSQLTDPDLAGTVRLSFEIDGSGEISPFSVRIEKSSMKNRDFEWRLESFFRRVHFENGEFGEYKQVIDFEFKPAQQL